MNFDNMARAWISKYGEKSTIFDSNNELLDPIYTWGLDGEIDKFFNFMEALLSHDLEMSVISNVAAGPVEDMFNYMPFETWTGIENRISDNPDAWKNILSCVWQSDIPDVIWGKILKVAPKRL